MLSDRVVLRKMRPADFVSVSSGFNEAFSSDRGLDEWEWKLRTIGEHSSAVVADDAEDGIIAYYGGPLRTLTWRGRRYLAVQPADVYRLKRPGTAGEMVFSQLVLEAMRVTTEEGRIALGYGFPGTRHMDIGTDRLGYEDPSDVGYMGKCASLLDRVPLRRLRRIRYDFDNPDADDLWRRARHRYGGILERDSSYVKHRYVDHPTNDYVCLTCAEGGRLAAWAVVKIGPSVVQWVDLLWDGESALSLLALENAVAGIASKRRIFEMEMWLKGDLRAVGILSKRGWQRRPNPVGVAFTAFSLAAGPELDASALSGDIYVTMGDNDLV